MKLQISVLALGLLLSSEVMAKGGYNDAPADDAQYKQCLVDYAPGKGWEGGNEPSKVAGQTKTQAFCECLWNEVKGSGSLQKAAEGNKAKNKLCEDHSGWKS